MTKTKSRYVCALCGCAVTTWHAPRAERGFVWKHETGGARKSCGKPPVVVERAEYERGKA